MKAAQIFEYGGVGKIQISEVQKPHIGTTQMLVRAYASSLNPADTGFRTGWMEKIMPMRFPITLGGDIAGIVEEVGPDVANFAIGDRVYGQAYIIFGNSGALAEYVAVNAGQMAKMPKGISFTDAGSLPLVGVSAVQALYEHMNMQAGQKILIHGGSGGIGSIAIPIAKHLGCYVATTVPTDAVTLASELGADRVLDYKTEHFENILKDYDAVLDLVGGQTFEKSIQILKPGGSIVTLVAMLDDAIAQAKAKGYNVQFQLTKVSTGVLNKLTSLVEQGVVAAHVTKVFSLQEIQAAFTYLETKSYSGKIVIKIQSEG